MAVVHVVDMIAVHDGRMTAIRSVRVILMVSVRCMRGGALVPVVIVGAVHMAVVEIVDMVAVNHRRVATLLGVHVLVLVVCVARTHDALLNPGRWSRRVVMMAA
jgi:hypothetical protein